MAPRYIIGLVTAYRTKLAGRLVDYDYDGVDSNVCSSRRKKMREFWCYESSVVPGGAPWSL